MSQAIRQLSQYINERKRIEAELSTKNRELTKIREAAEVTNRVKADFFEQVGASLMKPSKTIMEYADSMRSELFGAIGNAKYKEMAVIIHEETGQIIEMLEDVSAISRAETGLLALSETPLDIGFMIKKCLRLLRDKPQFKHMEVISDVDDNVPKLLADELRIKQVFLNLLMCVARQTEEEDVIRVFAKYRQEQIIVEMVYTPQDVSRFSGSVNELPRRARYQDALSASSFGLGFALSQLIVSMHEGEVLVKSMPDRTAKIEIIFPKKRSA